MVGALAGQQQEVVLTRVLVQQRAVVETEVNNQGHGSLTDHVILLSVRTHAPSSILSRVSSSEGMKTPTHTHTHTRVVTHTQQPSMQSINAMMRLPHKQMFLCKQSFILGFLYYY